MKYKQLVTAGASMVAIFGSGALAPSALAQPKPVILKMAMYQAPTDPVHLALQEWADNLAKDSGGSVTSTIYPSEQLGKAGDLYNVARDGIAEMSQTIPGYQPGRFPLIAAVELPFMVPNGVEGTVAVDTWYRKYAGTEMKDVHYCFSVVLEPGLLHSRRRVTTPADVKGLKVRPTGPIVAQMVNMLGGTTVRATGPEARDVLERGVADAITFPYGFLVQYGIDKAVSFHLDMPFYTGPITWVLNKAAYDGMAPAQKQAVDRACSTEAARKVAVRLSAFEAGGRDKVKATPGHELVIPTPAQVAEWKVALEPVRKVWIDSVAKTGFNAETVLNELMTEVAKRK